MEFKFTEEQEKFRKEVREYLLQQLPPGWDGYGYLFDFPNKFWDLRQSITRKVREKGWGPGGKLSEIQHLILIEEGFLLRCARDLCF